MVTEVVTKNTSLSIITCHHYEVSFMNDSELKKILKVGKPTRKNVDRGLYFRVSAERSATWVLRFMLNGERKELTLGKYGNKADELTLRQARDKAAETRVQINQGLNPIAEKKRPKRNSYISVNDIANKWLKSASEN